MLTVYQGVRYWRCPPVTLLHSRVMLGIFLLLEPIRDPSRLVLNRGVLSAIAVGVTTQHKIVQITITIRKVTINNWNKQGQRVKEFQHLQNKNRNVFQFKGRLSSFHQLFSQFPQLTASPLAIYNRITINFRFASFCAYV